MAAHVIKKGLDLPIAGQPEQTVENGARVTRVAVVGHDYPTMKPRMYVQEGDKVQTGQLLFEDRKSEGVRFTSPGAGTVEAIHRGDKRVLQSVVIALDTTEEQVAFEHYTPKAVANVSGEEARALLSESGLWTALRMRPFSRVPSIDEHGKNLFVTAIDTNPLAPSVEAVVAGRDEHFRAGLQILSTLTEGSVFLCVGPKWTLSASGIARVKTETFKGPHPAGLVGTHMHMLAPVNRNNPAWHVGYQDVLAIGELFLTGQLNTQRVVSLAGPVVNEPRLLRTRLGANISELAAGETAGKGKEIRLISGSVLFGHNATDGAMTYLNRYDNQISALAEERERVFLGWLSPGFQKFSTVRAIMGAWVHTSWTKLNFTTTTHGSDRAMVPIGMFERVMPLDIMPTFLLRSIVVGDLERAEQLGCLELHEEDLALCTFVSPGKADFGKALRDVLTSIWTEG